MTWKVRSDDLAKLGGLILFLLAGLAGHYDKLPNALQPYKDWFEFAGYLGGLVSAWRIVPARNPEHDHTDRASDWKG